MYTCFFLNLTELCCIDHAFQDGFCLLFMMVSKTFPKCEVRDIGLYVLRGFLISLGMGIIMTFIQLDGIVPKDQILLNRSMIVLIADWKFFLKILWFKISAPTVVLAFSWIAISTSLIVILASR